MDTNILLCASLCYLVLESAPFICEFLNGIWINVYIGVFNIFRKSEQKPDMVLQTHHFLLFRNYSVQ